MTREEFLSKLQESLENDLDSREVSENMAYYRSYIDEQVRAGHSESEVLEELGDPWVIAQSVIQMSENPLVENETYSDRSRKSAGSDRRGEAYSDPWGQSFRTYRIDTWWKKALLILAIIAIFCLIFAIVGGILSLVAPILVPVLMILFIIRLITRGRW